MASPVGSSGGPAAKPGSNAADGAPVEGPVQIITVDATGVGFEMHEARLNYVLSQVPPGMKVAVVSVVGAFRTGKSFILDVFLRYLRWTDEHPELDINADSPPSDAWLYGSSDDEPLEGNVLTSAPDYSRVNDSKRSGFKWRGGHERMTTGIWLWSRPFLRRLPGSSERVAVLLMDTQGLFDSETGQMLTTSIFGLSTLISSVQVYNVTRQIQEDQLQHLALFTEYGRRVLEQQQARAAKEDAAAPPPPAAPRGGGDGAAGEQGSIDEDEDGEGDGGVGATDAVAALRSLGATSSGAQQRSPPFQRLEFLIRDAVIRSLRDPLGVEAEMQEHLERVLAKDFNKDLKSVRDHIRACFADLSAYALPHPGYAVAENDQYSGRISEIRDEFRKLLVFYVHRVFERQLTPKAIAGRFVGAAELGRYVSAYARLFRERTGFPEAKMLLEATAEANNRNAHDAALKAYSSAVEAFFTSGYCSDAALDRRHAQAEAAALALFDQLANFGSEGVIAGVRTELADTLRARGKQYRDRNAERDPLKVIGPVIIALLCAFGAWVAKQLIDLTCAPWLNVCRTGSQFFGFIYSVILVTLFGLGYWHRSTVKRYTNFLAPIAKQVTGLVSASLSSALDSAKGAGGPAGGVGSGRPLTAPAALPSGAPGIDIDEQGDGDDGFVDDDAGHAHFVEAEPASGLSAAQGMRRRRRD